MGGVRDEVAPHLLLSLEGGGHLVERIGEARELLRALAGDAGGVVAVGDPTGRGTDLGEGLGEHPREDDREPDAGEHGDQGGRDDHGRDRVVVHVPGVLGRVAGLHHQRGEDVGADHGHADGEDHEPHGGRGDRRQRDPTGDAPRDHVRAAR